MGEDLKYEKPQTGLGFDELGYEWLVINGERHYVSHEIFVLARWLWAILETMNTGGSHGR